MKHKYALNEKTHGSPVVWVWGFCVDSRRFFCGYEMGLGLKSSVHGGLGLRITVSKCNGESIILYLQITRVVIKKKIAIF